MRGDTEVQYVYIDIDGGHHRSRDLPKDPLCLVPSKEVSRKVLGQVGVSASGTQ
jgi:hypothetical protein